MDMRPDLYCVNPLEYRFLLSTLKPRRHLISGRTHAGKVFRPSDWAERLSGVLSAYRPGYVTGSYQNPLAGFSPYAQPVMVDGVRCVLVDQRIEELEPMAWAFVVGFAADNELPMTPYEADVL